MGELLKEAIADAKAIRATALANAKLALQESFMPTLERMISDKIQYEADEEGEGDNIEIADEPAETDIDVAPAIDEVPPEGGEEVPAEEPVVEPTEPEEEIPVGEEVKFGGKVTADAGADPEAVKKHNPSLPGGKEDWAPVKEGEEEESDEEENDELDLESIIKELEAEADEEEATDEAAVAKYGFGKPVGGEIGSVSVSENEKKEEDDEEEDEVDETILAPNYKNPPKYTKPGTEKHFDEVVKKGGKATADAGKDPEAVKKHNPSFPGGKEDWKPVKEGMPGVPGEEGMDTKEVDLDALLAELEADDAATMDKDVDGGSSVDAYKEELESVRAELAENKQVVAFLKSKLNELNLLNAKLLFTNRLFKQNELSNSQKMKVIESFDRAKTLREVKLVYSTIAESVAQKSVKKPSAPVKKITEGASRQVASTKPAMQKVVKDSIVDSASVARLQKLANIKK